MPVRRPVPTTVAEVVDHYDYYIEKIILRIGRHGIRPQDLDDIKQSVYARLCQPGMLDRFDSSRGVFTTYLFQIIRSATVNTFRANFKNPVSTAYGLGERQSGEERLPHARKDVRLLSQTWDEAFEDRAVLHDALERCRAFAASAENSAELLATLRACENGANSPATVQRETRRHTQVGARALETLRAYLRQLDVVA